MKGFINNYEDLQEWIKSTKAVGWNLYSGWPEKFTASHFLGKSDDETDPDASWELLKRMIEMHSSAGGRFTVYVPLPGNRGFSTRIQIGNVNATANVAGMAGIGYPGLGVITVDEHERRLREFEEKMKLERRIEDLESQQGSSVGAFGKILDKITEELDINNVFNAAVAIFGPKLNPNMQPLQLSGTPVHDETEDEHADGSGYTYDDPRLLVFLDKVRSKFGTAEEFYTFLLKVGEFFEKNPQLAMSFFAKS